MQANFTADIILGKISRTHGVRGIVVLRIEASMRDAVREGLPLLLDSEGVQKALTVRSCSNHRSGLLVSFHGIENREQAQALVGSRVSMSRSEAPQLEEGEYFDCDVIGCEVLAGDGSPVGKVKEVLATGANDVYVVEAPPTTVSAGQEASRGASATRGQEILVPAISTVVLELNVEEKRIVVDPTGLLYPEPGHTESRKSRVAAEARVAAEDGSAQEHRRRSSSDE